MGGGAAGGSRYNGPVRGDDIRYEVRLSFEEAAKGCEKEINLVRDETCETCHGTGAKPGTSPQTCQTCHGTGQVRVTTNTAFGRIQNVRTCDACHGTGKTISDPCPSAMDAARYAPPSGARSRSLRAWTMVRS